MQRVFLALLVCLSAIAPAGLSFAQTEEDSNLASEISGEESEAQAEVQEVDSDMSLPDGGA